VTPGVFVANFHTESLAPFSLNGDVGGSKYTPVTFILGSHTLSGTPFSRPGGLGTPAATASVHFNVIGVPPVTGPITSFTLINAATDVDIRTLVDNDTLNLASLPASLAIRANATGTIGSVK